MADIIKAATRDGYGKALVELGAIMISSSFSMQTLQRRQKQLCSKKRIRTDFLIPVSQRAT